MYLHDWATIHELIVLDRLRTTWRERPATGEESRQQLLSDFRADALALDGAEVLLASYTYEDYDGMAFVLFRRGDKLYEVNAGHCSCYGLEGQWKPEETTVQALAYRLEHGQVSNDYAAELRAVLAARRARPPSVAVPPGAAALLDAIA